MARLDVTALGLAAVLVLGTVCIGLLHARESARRMQCERNLSRIGVALHTYHEQQRQLPPTAMGEDVRDLFGIDDRKEVVLINWAQILLPLLDEPALSREFHPALPLSDVKNTPGRVARPAALLCASDPYNIAENPYVRVLPDGRHVEYARGNYALNAGTNMFCYFPGTAEQPCPNGFYTSWTPRFHAWGSGVGGFNKSFALTDFPNGLSRMVAAEEIRAGLLPVDSRGVWALGQIGASYTFAHGIHGDDGGPNSSATKADDVYGCDRVHEKFTPHELVRAGMPCCSYCKQSEQATARSLHGGGVNVLMLDGSTRFIFDSVNANVWHLLHNRDTADTSSSLALNSCICQLVH